MLRIGITGGIGSGKSTVCAVFEVLGIPVYYADKEAKTLINTDAKLMAKIKTLLGDDAYLNDGYNVPYVAKKVFSDENLLLKLNKIVHPAVAKHFEDWVAKQQNKPYIIKEAAIMQKGADLDKIIYVHTSVETRINRILARDEQRTIENVLAIMEKQNSETGFKTMADFVIENENELLTPQVLDIHEALV